MGRTFDAQQVTRTHAHYLFATEEAEHLCEALMHVKLNFY